MVQKENKKWSNLVNSISMTPKTEQKAQFGKRKNTAFTYNNIMDEEIA